jgi:hypothetical protein
MERLLVVIFLAIATLSFQAGAAILIWESDSFPGNGIIKGSTAQALISSHDMSIRGIILDKWVFNVSDSSHLVVDIKDVAANLFDMEVTLDNVLLCFNNGGSRLFDGALAEGKHTIVINGFVYNVNGKLEIRVDVLAAKIPAAAWLFGSALLGLAALTYRRKIAVFD